MTKTTNPEKTLADLKPGDPVVYNYGSRHSCDEVQYVERTTKTLVILKNEKRFRIKGGTSVEHSGRWVPIPRITVATEKDVKEIQRAVLARRLSKIMSSDAGTLGDALRNLGHFDESRATKAQLAKLSRLRDALNRVADIVREFDPSFKLHPDNEQDDS